MERLSVMRTIRPGICLEVRVGMVLSVYQIHEAVLAQTGGTLGLRDAAMLHAAVVRPFATFGGEPLYASDLEKAAALFHSLIKSHPFLDGTERTAFLAAQTRRPGKAVLLRMSRVRKSAIFSPLTQFLDNLTAGSYSCRPPRFIFKNFLNSDRTTPSIDC